MIIDGMDFNMMHLGIGAVAAIGLFIVGAGAFTIYDRWRRSREDGV